ncbi:Wzz/FepE/Etk N-terminal domain-containing protein (plasmid) [Salipiger sp. H15]|uniref:Wzz/FepE/Etk N-terminal domain-containing protein n=1 Tax=Alloyangia sp. H15 TaxID=3029062 RepID=A0AAU8AR03_9RHOB
MIIESKAASPQEKRGTIARLDAGQNERAAPSLSVQRRRRRRDANDDELTIVRLFGAVRRQWRAMCATVALFLALGLFIYTTTPDSYEAEAMVLVDDRLSQLADQIDVAPSFVRDETGFFNEVAVLNSRELALRVVRDLDLVDNAAFNSPPVSGAARLKSAISGLISVLKPSGSDAEGAGSAPPTREALEAQAADDLRSALRVVQVGRGYAINISYQSHDPALATQILRAFLSAYIAAPVNASEEAAEQALAWLEQRQNMLQQTLSDIDRQIIERRTGGGQASAAVDALLRRRAAIEQLQTSSSEAYESLVSSQQAVPFSGVKVLDAPKELTSPSAPSLPKWVVLSTLVGMLFAVFVAAMRELLDDKLRTAEQLMGKLDAPFLGYVPSMARVMDLCLPGRRAARKGDRRAVLLVEETLDQTLSLIGSRLAGTSRGHVVGVTSMLDGDGKSTFAACLATRAVERGLSALVVDADRHRAGLSTLLQGKLIDSAPAPQADLALRNSVLRRFEGRDFSAITHQSFDDAELPLPQTCSDVLDQVELSLEDHDLIIVDLPSLVISNEARLNVDRFDTLLFVAAWGATPRKLIDKYMELSPEFADHVDGLVLNRANLRKLRTYSAGGYEAFMGDL